MAWYDIRGHAVSSVFAFLASFLIGKQKALWKAGSVYFCFKLQNQYVVCLCDYCFPFILPTQEEQDVILSLAL